MIMVNDEKKNEARGTAAGLLNDRMTLSVRQTHAAAQCSRREKLGCGGNSASRCGGGVSQSSVACRWLPSYRDNERKVAVRRIVLSF